MFVALKFAVDFVFSSSRTYDCLLNTTQSGVSLFWWYDAINIKRVCVFVCFCVGGVSLVFFITSVCVGGVCFVSVLLLLYECETCECG